MRHLDAGLNVTPYGRGRLGADVATVRDTNQGKVALQVAGGVQLAVHWGCAISEGCADALVGNEVVHIWEGALVPSVCGGEREQKDAAEHRIRCGPNDAFDEKCLGAVL